MRRLTSDKIIGNVANTLIKASVSFRTDQIKRYEAALEAETNMQAKWVLTNILENAKVGDEQKLPLCDDTGIPHVFLEIGDGVSLPAGFLKAVDQGIAQGLQKLPGRPMAVRGNDVERLTQEAGLYSDPEKLIPAPIQVRRLPGEKVKLTVLMLGGGPEIRGKTMRVFHKHSLEVISNEMISWAKEGATLLGCQPCVLAFGIGRTNVEAASLALEAMKDGDLLEQSNLEQYLTDEVNKSNVGPLGVGGSTTALGTFIKVGPQRASGVRVVSLRVGCCFDPRKATYQWSAQDFDQ
ncbi:MAG: fumarate hydratase [Peptococcaceae bacterium BICA1-8]|nr:MAG: fumarate hydratase [Peptococcaceae bacterium BICA1-8]